MGRSPVDVLFSRQVCSVQPPPVSPRPHRFAYNCLSPFGRLLNTAVPRAPPMHMRQWPPSIALAEFFDAPSPSAPSAMGLSRPFTAQ